MRHGPAVGIRLAATTMLHRLILATVLTVLLLAPAQAQSVPPVGASGGPSYGGTTPGAAFDGDPATYWQGAYSSTNPNLSSPFDVTSWALTWGYSAPMAVSGASVSYATDSRFIATGAHVDCSTDGATWTQIATVPVAQTSSISLAATCQWVRLMMSPPGTGYTPAVATFGITAGAPPAPASTPTPTPVPGAPAPNTFAIPSAVTSLDAHGDSITAGSYAPFPYTAVLPIFREIGYSNTGRSGDSTADMLSRMSAALNTGAQMIVLMGGTNDVQFGWPASTSKSNLAQMVQQTRAAGREPVLVGPLPRNNVSTAGLVALRRAVQDLATEQGTRFVDPWPASEDASHPGWLRPDLTNDGVHTNGRGQYVLAREIAHTLGWGFQAD